MRQGTLSYFLYFVQNLQLKNVWETIRQNTGPPTIDNNTFSCLHSFFTILMLFPTLNMILNDRYCPNLYVVPVNICLGLYKFFLRLWSNRGFFLLDTQPRIPREIVWSTLKVSIGRLSGNNFFVLLNMINGYFTDTHNFLTSRGSTEYTYAVNFFFLPHKQCESKSLRYFC